MKIAGFSFVKNAVLYQYPIVEAIRSILPLCDEFVIAVGECEDGTLELIQNMNEPKLKIIETVWDENINNEVHVLAAETNKAFEQISEDMDWAFYIQGDEVVHEKYLDTIKANMLKYKDNTKVDGLLFNYLHFYGSYDYVGTSSNWYSHEIRVVKNKPNIYSHGDAQGFRKNDNEKLKVKPIDAYIYHYGWTREPEALKRKQTNFYSLYKGEFGKPKDFDKSSVVFEYEHFVNAVERFQGTHPKAVAKLIEKRNWQFDYDITMSRKSLKDKTKEFLKKYLGINAYYTNYIISKD
ncbi:glycosyltransferase family 2 protein [Aurantibacter crassamenti]|uniref:glycosyltransferase family 2 protein n=1 Tax=Aurantibacter crassamenti TaxID=1837375 RepID=UPI00193AD8E0|nr:glycosyltransferase family 2 protein [Aurantibacter crassamenti]MBM1105333.1 glycosyltransferase family 2 protein [Aurantibacter crassamenti]